MEVPTTPPRRYRLSRARTPPSPTHGPLHEEYEPYSPRRSTRSTLTSNPYSSVNKSEANGLADARETPAKKPRFAKQDLLSPPTSPANAARDNLDLTGTPRRSDNNNNHNITLGGNLHPSSSMRGTASLLPTPSRSTPSKSAAMTPARKHQRATSMQDTARILFQPDNPNDVMPKQRKQKASRGGKTLGFEVNADDFSENGSQRSGSFQIYAETQARIPQLDTSEDNPFYRPRTRASTIPQTRSSPRHSRKVSAQILEEEHMNEAVEQDRGMIYSFRGKKVFRKFTDVAADDSDIDQTARQRAMKRSVGASADRPLTRSKLQPKRLWGTFDSGYAGSDVDEEAETDLDVSDVPPIHDQQPTNVPITTASTPAKSKVGPQGMMTPASTLRAARKKDAEATTATRSTPEPTPARGSKQKKVDLDPIPIFRDYTTEPNLAEEVFDAPVPPTPQRSSRKKAAMAHLTPIIEDELGSGPSSSQESATTRRGKRSPFDNWPRTKGTHKRPGETLEGNSSKRTRGTAL